MLSEKQLLANQNNALRSTGPRTDAGKQVSSQNALKHGLRAENTVIVGEDPDQFEQFRKVLLEDLAPQGALEVFLADRIVAGFWKLRRAGRVETEILDGLHKDLMLQQQRRQEQVWADKQRSLLRRAIQQDVRDPDEPSDYDKTHDAWAASEQAAMIRENRWPTGPGHPTPEDAMKNFIADHTLKLRRERQARRDAETHKAAESQSESASQDWPDSTPSQIAEAVSLGSLMQEDLTGSNILARFRIYEGQIERSLYKALKELQKLQVLRAHLWKDTSDVLVASIPEI